MDYFGIIIVLLSFLAGIYMVIHMFLLSGKRSQKVTKGDLYRNDDE